VAPVDLCGVGHACDDAPAGVSAETLRWALCLDRTGLDWTKLTPVQVNIHEAKTHLSRLVDRAADGEDIVIARAGQPLVRLVRYTERSEPRVPGTMAGRIDVPNDFDETPDWLVDEFLGRL
jgi:prevent-host-death family protein